jgi:hypothetical protein
MYSEVDIHGCGRILLSISSIRLRTSALTALVARVLLRLLSLLRVDELEIRRTTACELGEGEEDDEEERGCKSAGGNAEAAE